MTAKSSGWRTHSSEPPDQIAQNGPTFPHSRSYVPRIGAKTKDKDGEKPQFLWRKSRKGKKKPLQAHKAKAKIAGSQLERNPRLS